MQTIARTTYLPAARTKGALLPRFLAWLVALDAGYRNAHRLADASEEHLLDVGISRSDAEAEFARRLGSVDYRRPVGVYW
jgi:uncharacterized protein YjiS (DUF1127 family)